MKILVLNPNGSTSVTQTISESIASLRARSQHEIVCDYLPAAPLGIETDAHVAEVAPMVAKAVEESDADVIVVACFSDPGVQLARQITRRPIIGIAEAAYYAALQYAPRFGVISLGPSSIARHAAHIERLGLTSRLAGDRSMQMTVAEAADPHGAAGAVARTGTALRDEDGAGVVILGCAGMGAHRPRLQAELGIPVIDPVQAATAAAITALDLELNVGAR
ncbi:aspartate/glutamate racemase family protein [Aminobacter sp. J44]|uniref:aspartate/glutamate racemase family protein n=1 Tax=Aminobacter sp. J44 TaxID=935262 RepID=UPI001198DFB6|nr:aspartate/glutamate racemase family protein [Aminobacter sp. J44]TWG53225.1 Asp/Glu/hydantoin racemase [Aminobacter sp. J44]